MTNHLPSPDDTVKMDDACLILRKRPRTIRQYIQQGRLSHYPKQGGEWLFSKTLDLYPFLNGQEPDPERITIKGKRPESRKVKELKA